MSSMLHIFKDRPVQTIIFLLFFVATLCLLFFRGNPRTAVIQIGEKRVYVEIAKTIRQQREGLGGREDLGSFAGMAFPIIPETQQGVVMRDMKFPIDIIWVRDGYIVDIARAVQPERGVAESELTVYYPRTEVNLILELESGFVENYAISIGDKVTLIDE